jgi:uncharacterized membrane protein
MEETPKVESTPKIEPPKGQTNVMALICYIGLLCLIPLLNKTKDEFVKFHLKQGLVLFGGEVVTWVVVAVIPILWVFGNLVGIFWLVLSIIGIMNVVKNRKKEIPVLGKFAERIKV